MPPVPEYQIYQEVKEYIKQYPTFSRLIQYDQPIKQRISGYEPRHKVYNSKSYNSDYYHPDSIRRTKTTISDLILSNKFDLFCTFTFDPKKVDRYNPDTVKKVMSKWLNNQRDLHGQLDYLIVPEFHKDGKAIHFHALIKNFKGKLKDTGKLRKQRPIYNITSFRSGYSTAVPIDNIEKVSSYVKKYITKDMPLFSGKKRYWCSTNLIRPYTIPNPIIDNYNDYTQVYTLENLTVSEHHPTIQAQLI